MFNMSDQEGCDRTHRLEGHRPLSELFASSGEVPIGTRIYFLSEKIHYGTVIHEDGNTARQIRKRWENAGAIKEQEPLWAYWDHGRSGFMIMGRLYTPQRPRRCPECDMLFVSEDDYICLVCRKRIDQE